MKNSQLIFIPSIDVMSILIFLENILYFYIIINLWMKFSLLHIIKFKWQLSSVFIEHANLQQAASIVNERGGFRWTRNS